MATKISQPQNVRVAGSGFTAFHVKSQPLGFCQSFVYTSPTPVAPPQPIQPMDAQRPIEIAVPAAISAGQIQLSIYELWNNKIWDQFMKILDSTNVNGENTNQLASYGDLADVLVRMANLGNTINCTRVIYPPFKVQTNKTQYYFDTFHGCKIVDIRDDESVDIGTMAIAKNLTISFTQVTRNKVSV